MSVAVKVRLQGLSPAALVKSQLANARLKKPLTICAGAVAQSVEFTSLTGLPEVQRLSETVREDARSGSIVWRGAHRRKKPRRCEIVFAQKKEGVKQSLEKKKGPQPWPWPLNNIATCLSLETTRAFLN